MGWFTKEEAPDELKGLTPEQIAEAVKKSKTQETELADAKTKLTELDAAKAKATENDALKARIAELEANAAPPRREAPKGPTSVLVDEDAAFRERTAPLTQFALNTAASVAKMEVRSGLKAKDRYVWDKYQGEIEKLMENDVRKATAAGWQAALTYIKGVHTEDITKPEFFAELGGESEMIGGRRDEPKNDDKLSDEELAVCKKMGVKPEDYLAQRKAMTVEMTV